MKKKIFIIIDHLGTGGAQRQVIEYLKRADRVKFDITIVNLDESYAPLVGEIETLGYRVISVKHSGFLNLDTIFKLVRLFRKEKPDIVHTYLFTADCYGRLAAKLAGARIIISSVRNIDLWQRWYHILADRMLAKFTDGFTINAEKIRSHIIGVQKIDPIKISTIYNGIDLGRFNNLRNSHEVRAELGLPKDASVVGMVSRFGDQKDYDTFFKAAEEVVKRDPNVYFVAVGDGPNRKWFESLYAKKAVPRIIFTGHRNDTPDIINAMDICVLTSHYEGCPNVVLEYMACSQPVIASDVGGCAELIVDGRTGYIMPEADPHALIDKLMSLLDKGLEGGIGVEKGEEKGKRRAEMGREGRRRVEEKFTSDIMVKNTENLYDGLLKPKTAFVLSQFPCYDETFIQREMNRLRASGLDFLIYSIKRCKDKVVHPKAKELIGITRYLPLFSFRILFINLFSLLRHPLSYTGTFLQVFIGNFKSPNFLLKSVGLWPQAVAFAHMAKKDKISHVHGQWATYPATFAFIISKLNNITFSFTGHAHDIYMDTTMLAKKIREAEFVVTCTEDNKRYLQSIVNRDSPIHQSIDAVGQSHSSDKIIVNYHGVDLGKFDRSDRPETEDRRPFKILSVGSLLESKGFDILIDACKILQDKQIDFECVIAGGGPLEEKLKLSAKRYSLDAKITFTGYITQDKLIPYYLDADAFALPVKLDIHWGIPNVFIEAMAGRLPVISTALPSILELITDALNGFIIPEKDPQALADKLIILAKDPELRSQMGESGHRVVREKFDIKKNALNLKELFTMDKTRKIRRRPFRSMISTLFYLTGSFKSRKGIVVLMYHRVNDSLEPNDLVVGIETFRRQIEYLHENGYTVISAEDMIKKLKDPNYRAGDKEVVITFDDGYRDNYINAYPVLKKYNFPATVFLTAGMIGTNKKRPRYEHLPSPDMLTWEEIKEMAGNGITFGGHTIDHPNLDKIAPEEARREIEVSKRTVESKGLKTKIFAYPYGDYNAEVKNIVMNAGFECAFTTAPGINRPGCDLFELKRTEMNGVDSLFDFRKKLNGAYDILHRLSEWRRKGSVRIRGGGIGEYKGKEGEKEKGGKKSKEEETEIASASLTFGKQSRPRNDGDGAPKRVNVLYVIWSLGLGGAEQVVINLVRNLDKTRFNPIVCCLNGKGKFSDELEKEGVKVIELNKRWKIDPGIIPRLMKIMRQNRIDIVNTHLWGANFWGRIAAKMAGVKVIIATEHNADTWKMEGHYFLDRLLSRWTDRVIAVSDSVKDFYVRTAGLKPEKMTVIHNGVDAGLFQGHKTARSGIREEFKVQDGETVLALIGRLVPQKGHKFFISALKDLSRDSKVKGLIIGSGPLEAELKTYAGNLGFNGNLIFTGLRKDVPDIFDIIDILVMPSLREGLPIVALEAMAKNKPVVATNVGGNPEVIVDGKTGILVPPEDPLALRSAMKRLIDDKEYAIKLGANGNNRLKEHFSVKKMVASTETLYDECLNRKKI